MIYLLVGVVGLGLGCILNQVSETLPRRSLADASRLDGPQPPVCALWYLVSRYFRRGAHPAPPNWFWLHLAVEVIGAGFSIALWLVLDHTAESFLLAGAIFFFLLIAIIDLKTRLVLNVLVYPALITLPLIRVVFFQQPLANTLIGGGLAFTIFYLTALLRPGDLGGGDVKLAALIGLLVGFPGVLWALLVGAVAGGIAAVYLLLVRSKGRKSQIPYAPFLSLGAIVCLLYNPLMHLM